MILAIFLLSAFVFTSAIAAADVNVNSTSATGIRGGIDASTTNHGDTIVLSTGTYKGTNNNNMTINKNLTIKWNGQAKDVIIDASKNSRIFGIGENTAVTFTNITFQNGNSTYGGAVYSNQANSKITFINCIFTNNTASYSGGAIVTEGYCSVVNSTFTNNVAKVGSAIWNEWNCSVVNSIFSNNNASVGTVYNPFSSNNLTAKDNTFISNTGGNFYGIFTGSGNVNATEIKTTSTISTSVSSDKITITVTTTALNGDKIKNQAILLSVNGKQVATANTNDNGVATYTYTAPSPGKYTINALLNEFRVLTSASEANIYLASSAPVATANVVQTPTSLNLSFVPNAAIGQTVVIKAVLKDQNGNPLMNKAISLNVAGAVVNLVTNSNGEVSTNYLVKMLGLKTITATFAGDANSKSSSSTGNLNIVKATSNILLSSYTAYYGQTITVKGVLKDQFGNVLTGKAVKLNVAGIVVNLVSNNIGEISYTYVANKFMGANSIVANFAGDSLVTASSKTSTLTVVKSKPTLTLTTIKPLFKKSNTIKYTLKGQNGKVIAGKTVKLFVNGKVVATAKTNTAGVATFKYTFKTKKTHNVLAKFAADANYAAKNSATFKAIPK